MNKRTERVKSIFDSDDSEDENNVSSIGHSYLQEDEEDELDSKLRKTIDEVCSSLGNDRTNEKNSEEIVQRIKSKSSSPNSGQPFDKNDLQLEKNDSSLDSEGEEDIKKDESPTKFNIIPILEENEYNLLSEFCKETVETRTVEEVDIKSKEFDEIKDKLFNREIECMDSEVVIDDPPTDSEAPEVENSLNNEKLCSDNIYLGLGDKSIDDALVIEQEPVNLHSPVNEIELTDSNKEIQELSTSINIDTSIKNISDGISETSCENIHNKSIDTLCDNSVKESNDTSEDMHIDNIVRPLYEKVESDSTGADLTCKDSHSNIDTSSEHTLKERVANSVKNVDNGSLDSSSETINDSSIDKSFDQVNNSAPCSNNQEIVGLRTDLNEESKYFENEVGLSKDVNEESESKPLCETENFEQRVDESIFTTDDQKGSDDQNIINNSIHDVSMSEKLPEDVPDSPTGTPFNTSIEKEESISITECQDTKDGVLQSVLVSPARSPKDDNDTNVNSFVDTVDSDQFKALKEQKKSDTNEVTAIEASINTFSSDMASEKEKDTHLSTVSQEMKIGLNSNLEGDKKRKVRVEDVFTDSENETTPSLTISHSLFKSGVDRLNRIQFKSTDSPLKKIRRKRPRATSINLPAIMLAFEKGWVREVVYRASANLFPKKADVYYYTPEGKKLRSRVEIEDYIKKNNIVDLTLQNFSFFKEPLGVEECYEKIRHASSSSKLQLSSNDAEEPLLVKPARKRVRKAALPGEDSAIKKLKTQMQPKNTQLKEIAPKNIAPKNSQQCYGSGNFPNLTNNYSPIYATHLFPCNPPLTHPRIVTPLIRASKHKAFHCTPNCIAGGGNVPNLQCVKCICLFHPDCCHMPPATVPLILSSQAKFLCPNCYKEEVENVDEKVFTPVEAFEPLAYDPPSDSEDEGLCSDFEHPSYARLPIRPSTPPTPPVQVRQFNNLHGSNTSLPAPPLAISDTGIYSQNSPSVQNMSFVLPLVNGLGTSVPQYVYFPPSLHQVSITNSLPKSTLTNSQADNNSLPLSSFLRTTPSNANSYSQLSPTSSPIVEETSTILEQPVQKSLHASRTLPEIAPFLRGGEHFMEDMSKSYNVLRNIFSYLSVPDLLIVSRVCHMWRDLALGPSFWATVRLRNVCVKHWDKMVEFLEKRGTTSLDLRKMVLRIGTVDKYVRKIHMKNNSGRSSRSNSPHEMETENEKDKYESFISKEEIENEKAMEMEGLVGNKINEIRPIEDNRTFLVNRTNPTQENKNSLPENVQFISLTNMPEGSKDSRLIQEETKISFKSEKEDNESDSILEINNILVNEIKTLNRSVNLQHPENDAMKLQPTVLTHELNSKGTWTEDHNNAIQDSEERERYKCDRSNMEVDKEKQKEIQQDKIVTSVLSEHDYFGHQRKVEESRDSNSSSEDDDSESQTDQNDLEAERVLDEKLEFHKKNVEDGNLKETLQWEHEPRFNPSRHILASSTEIGIQQIEKEVEFVCKLKQKHQIVSPLNREWDAISIAISNLRCLRSIVVGPCDSMVVELILSHCYQLTSITALNLTPSSDTEAVISFDPSFLMHTKELREFRLGSKKNFVFKSNFNFIKLPHLKVLMLKGLKTAETGWPYMGIHLTHLHLSCINTFSHKNWLNVSSMTGLLELELDGNGADFDAEICVALTKLVQLKRLALLDWNIGPKLPFTLRKLQNIKYLHVIPAAESPNLRGIYAGRLMVMLDFTKHLEEFVWGIQPPNRIMDEKTGEKIYIQTMKPGKETGVMEGEKVRAIAIDSFKGFIKCRIPQTKVTVRKVAASNWITGDGWF